MNRKISNKVIRESVRVGLAIAGGFGLVYCLGKLQLHIINKEIKQIETHEGNADCVIKKAGNKKGNYVVAVFNYKGRSYEIEESAYSGDVIPGQNFRLKFDTTDPLTARVMFDQPFFKPTDITSYARGEVFQVDSRTVRFRYTVGDIEFKKFQKYTEGRVFNVGDVRTVEYLVTDLRNAILMYN